MTSPTKVIKSSLGRLLKSPADPVPEAPEAAPAAHADPQPGAQPPPVPPPAPGIPASGPPPVPPYEAAPRPEVAARPHRDAPLTAPPEPRETDGVTGAISNVISEPLAKQMQRAIHEMALANVELQRATTVTTTVLADLRREVARLEAEITALRTRADLVLSYVAWRDQQGIPRILIERRNIGDVFVVTDGAAVFNADHQWEFEPLPSNRTDAFIARTRCSEAEAWQRAAIAIAEIEAQYEARRAAMQQK